MSLRSKCTVCVLCVDLYLYLCEDNFKQTLQKEDILSGSQFSHFLGLELELCLG